MNIEFKINFDTYFSNVLTTSGVLLGLAFAAMTYILENGFASFKYNRLMFLKLFTEFGKMILYILSYLVINSFIYLSVDASPILTSIFYIFSFIFLKSLLDYNKHKGYIHTILTNKFVPPAYGKLRSYFRFITNLGLVNSTIIFFQFFTFILLPIYISYVDESIFRISERSLALSSGIYLVYSVFMIARFIPQFALIANTEYEANLPSADNQNDGIADININYKVEKETLNKYLESKGIKCGEENPIEFLGSQLKIFPTNDLNPEAWFNIIIKNPNGDPLIIRDSIDKFAHRLLTILSESNSDINSFVLSFHIYIAEKSWNIFFRSNKAELNKIKDLDFKNFTKSIESKIYAEIFRDLQ
ncbi:hypothetical protein [Leptospira bandrabouensis]|uniref:hypothetical protein n=1 Tax=Leptospira bandrabouensis TaxID=2484903 RepID=UPI001EE97B7B|nr:hypothetical protein [Leptospira bandrabouensis]MCG6146628.1 hypothetical protein [Leptospira bandrabouensis]MCG6161991.1 hypothetical protein [Leptospira bandrabouensis]MCG6166203.1 hypothetical protein [Leptospira bandrabouensis]